MRAALPHHGGLVVAGAVLFAQQRENVRRRLGARVVSDDPGRRHGDWADDVLAAIVLEAGEDVVLAGATEVQLVERLEPRGKDYAARLEVRDRAAQALAGYGPQAVEFAPHPVAVDLLKQAA